MTKKIVRNHSDIAECREASAQQFERKLNALLANISGRKSNPFPTAEEKFQITQLKADVKRWRDESQRHLFQSQLHDPFVCVK